MRNVMIDLETLGTGHHPVVLSIGAVLFVPGEPESFNPFYVVIDPRTSQAHGCNIDADTVMWWLRQSDEARSAFDSVVMAPLPSALRSFTEWLPKYAKVWGNGSNFDNRILREVYEAVGYSCPWHYRDDRDMRTYMADRPAIPRLDRTGVHHNALDDARFQVRCMATAESIRRARAGEV